MAIRQRVDGFDLTGFYGQTQRLGCNLEKPAGVGEIEPRLDAVLGSTEEGIR
ncbi:hypothetical protein [Bradyrhizobium sp. BRP22]|uniref:hypothetical protein n=1 Tax=Bradyrhizobium sp. BRP22 TaxID=2793821 RepID=UPI001CD2896D|nr:hypothetical protein [Bradyrhizobium sp. BRP22]